MIGTVIVHNPDQLRAVFQAAERNRCACRAVTSSWSGPAHGALYWAKAAAALRTAQPHADVTVVLHCGRDAGLALAALREKWPHLVFDGDPAVVKKIADIAAKQGATLLEAPAVDALDIGRVPDADAALDAWMVERRRCK